MDPETRLDKWLWAARFFKTRQLAQQAVNGGKIRLNNQPVKPGRRINPGDRLTIRRGDSEQTILVIANSAHRGPATVATKLYRETPESLAKRETLASYASIQTHPKRDRPGRPSKRERRQIEKLLP